MKAKKERSFKLVFKKNEIAKLTDREMSSIKGKTGRGCQTDMEAALSLCAC